MIEIPIFSSTSSDFVQSIELDEIFITIRLKFNVRNESWFISVSTENYELKDIRGVVNFPILKQYKANFPELPGDLFIQRILETEDTDVNYDNLGNSYGLLYYNADEVAQWEANYGL